MARLARSLLLLLSLGCAALLWRAAPTVGLDFQGGAHLELIAADPGTPTESAVEQVQRAVAALDCECEVSLRHGAIVVHAADFNEADADRLVRAVQDIDPLARGRDGDAATRTAGPPIPLTEAVRLVVASSYPRWCGLPLLRALALAAALAWAWTLVAREPARWLPTATRLACLPLAALVLAQLGGVLTRSFYFGAAPATVAAGLAVRRAALQAHRPLLRRLLAAWPGWLLLLVAAVLAVAMTPMSGFWRGVAVAGIAAIPAGLTLALFGVIAAGSPQARDPRT